MVYWMIAAGLAVAPVEAQGAAPLAPQCELHVWGAGRPNIKYPARLMRQIDPAQLDRSNPLSNVNVFNSVNRAGGLSDAALKQLLPGAGQVRVVRHGEMIDLDQVKLANLTAPLAPQQSGCYADLVITNIYGLFPNPNAQWQMGLVGSTVAAVMQGSDRLVIDFWFRDFSGADRTMKLYKRKNDSPLPHVPFMTAEMKAAVEASTDVNFQNFVAFVDGKRAR